MLIVDDNPVVRSLVAGVVRQSHPDATVTEAADVASALEAARRSPVDVGFVDIGLPDGSGLRLLGRLRDANPAATLACCTAYDLPEYREEALRRGADFWLAKETLDATAIRAVAAEGLERCAAAGLRPDTREAPAEANAEEDGA